MKLLDFNSTIKILKKYGIKLEQLELCQNEKQAIAFSKKIGFPVVLKVCDPSVVHKTEKKGVITNIETEKQLKESFNQIKKGFKNLEGIIIQKQFSGNELVVGMKRDDTFGPVIMVGLGGILVELLKDVSFGVCPISKKQASQMIKDFKGSDILFGFRNQEKCNVQALNDLIVNLSKLAQAEDNISAIDFNPVFIDKKGISIADFRIIQK